MSNIPHISFSTKTIAFRFPTRHISFLRLYDEFKHLDGAWFRAFDYESWDYWASNADAGWGAWSTLTGWIQSWIVGTQVLLEENTSLWDLLSDMDMSDISKKVISDMMEDEK